MLKSLMLASVAMSLMSTAAFAAETGTGSAAAPAPEGDKETKSIVPKKYAGKYKGGGADDLAKFINEQCNSKPDKDGKGGGEFEYPAFFLLCAKNGVPQEQIDKYKAQVDEGKQGANGRARMTLRNMLAARVRKAEGKVIGLDDSEHTVAVAKPAVSGAAKEAKEGNLQGAAAEATGSTDGATEQVDGAAADAAEANAEASGIEADEDATDGVEPDEDGTTGTDDE